MTYLSIGDYICVNDVVMAITDRTEEGISVELTRQGSADIRSREVEYKVMTIQEIEDFLSDEVEWQNSYRLDADHKIDGQDGFALYEYETGEKLLEGTYAEIDIDPEEFGAIGDSRFTDLVHDYIEEHLGWDPIFDII